MSARKIQIGQLWKKDGTAETYLVTRVYPEALSTIAVLRKSGSENENQLRVKVERTPAGQNLPGFSPPWKTTSSNSPLCGTHTPVCALGSLFSVFFPL